MSTLRVTAYVLNGLLIVAGAVGIGTAIRFFVLDQPSQEVATLWQIYLLLWNVLGYLLLMVATPILNIVLIRRLGRQLAAKEAAA